MKRLPVVHCHQMFGEELDTPCPCRGVREDTYFCQLDPAGRETPALPEHEIVPVEPPEWCRLRDGQVVRFGPDDARQAARETLEEARAAGFDVPNPDDFEVVHERPGVIHVQRKSQVPDVAGANGPDVSKARENIPQNIPSHGSRNERRLRQYHAIRARGASPEDVAYLRETTRVIRDMGGVPVRDQGATSAGAAHAIATSIELQALRENRAEAVRRRRRKHARWQAEKRGGDVTITIGSDDHRRALDTQPLRVDSTKPPPTLGELLDQARVILIWPDGQSRELDMAGFKEELIRGYEAELRERFRMSYDVRQTGERTFEETVRLEGVKEALDQGHAIGFGMMVTPDMVDEHEAPPGFHEMRYQPIGWAPWLECALQDGEVVTRRRAVWHQLPIEGEPSGEEDAWVLSDGGEPIAALVLLEPGKWEVLSDNVPLRIRGRHEDPPFEEAERRLQQHARWQAEKRGGGDDGS